MYAKRLIPANWKLAKRLLTEVNHKQVIHQIRRNLKTDMYTSSVSKGIIVPNAIYIDPTYRCNRACKGCYVIKGGSIIHYKIAESVVSFAQDYKVNYIAVLGGEPLLPDVRCILFNLMKNFPKMSFNFCTNSDFLNKDLADRITKYPNLTPFISIDGFQKNHDNRRGTGSFKKSMKGMDLLKERRLLFGYMATVMPENYKELASDSFLEFMINKGAIIGGYSLYYCLSKTDPNLNSLEYGSFIKTIQSQAFKYPIFLLSTDYGYLGNKNLEPKSKKLIAITVGPNGEVKTERGSIALGQITSKNSLEDIILNPKIQKIFKDKIQGTGQSPDPRIAILQKAKIT